MDSHRFMAGQFDTRFVEERFSMDDAVEARASSAEIAAILATLVEHQQSERSAQVVRRNEQQATAPQGGYESTFEQARQQRGGWEETDPCNP